MLWAVGNFVLGLIELGGRQKAVMATGHRHSPAGGQAFAAIYDVLDDAWTQLPNLAHRRVLTF